MNSNFYNPFFKIAQRLVRRIYPKYQIEIPKMTDEPVVYISHHQNMFGPFITLLWFPKSLHAWILHVFLDQEACFRQYVDFTFTKRFGLNQMLAKLCAFPISFFITRLLNSGKGIPVFRGSRKILQTFQVSIDALSRGESIVIFPDVDYSDSSGTIKELYDGFLYLDKYYYKATGKHVCFMPLYISKKKRMLIAEKEIYFRDGMDFNTERKIVIQKIHKTLNDIAAKCGDR